MTDQIHWETEWNLSYQLHYTLHRFTKACGCQCTVDLIQPWSCPDFVDVTPSWALEWFPRAQVAIFYLFPQVHSSAHGGQAYFPFSNLSRAPFASGKSWGWILFPTGVQNEQEAHDQALPILLQFRAFLDVSLAAGFLPLLRICVWHWVPEE